MTSFSAIGLRLALVAAVVTPVGVLLARPKLTLPANGGAVIRAMHDKYATTWYKTLSFTQKTTRRTPADTMVIETWRERAMLPGHLRIDVERTTGTLSIVYTGDSSFAWRHDSTLTRTANRNILLIIGFDVYRQPAETTLAVLDAEHFPMTPMREDTWKGRPVYVIGGAVSDLHSYQLWIDKERLLFVRGIQPDERDTSKTIDMRFDNYVKVPAGWLSETVEVYRDGTLVQREEYSDVRTNVPIDPRIFSPPAERTRRTVPEDAKRSGSPLFGEGGWDAAGWDIPELVRQPAFVARVIEAAPVFLYHSRDDEVVPFEHSRLSKAHLSKVTFREYDGRGHQFNSVYSTAG